MRLSVRSQRIIAQRFFPFPPLLAISQAVVYSLVSCYFQQSTAKGTLSALPVFEQRLAMLRAGPHDVIQTVAILDTEYVWDDGMVLEILTYVRRMDETIHIVGFQILPWTDA